MGSKRSLTDAQYTAFRELASDTSCARLTLSTTSAATGTLPAGVYVVSLYAPAGIAYATLGASITLPPSGGTPSSGVFALRDGERVALASASQIAVILSSGTGEVAFTKVL